MSDASRKAAMETAIEKGVSSITENGRTVAYPSVKDAAEVLASAASADAVNTGHRQGFRVSKFKSSRT